LPFALLVAEGDFLLIKSNFALITRLTEFQQVAQKSIFLDLKFIENFVQLYKKACPRSNSVDFFCFLVYNNLLIKEQHPRILRGCLICFN
jgi:hypothetical protein